MSATAKTCLICKSDSGKLFAFRFPRRRIFILHRCCLLLLRAGVTYGL